MNMFSGRTGANYEPMCPHYDTEEQCHGEAGDGIWFQAGTWYVICKDCGLSWPADEGEDYYSEGMDWTNEQQ